MFSNAEVAEVLEDAADLYESEKINWCSGSWGGASNSGLSGCAATSVAMAAGLGILVAAAIEINRELAVSPNLDVDHWITLALGHYDPEWREQQVIKYGNVFKWDARGVKLYWAVRAELEGRIGTSVLNFNDEYNQTKENVIELFKETAKELRNAQ